MSREVLNAGRICAALIALQLGCGGTPPHVSTAGDSVELKIVAHYDDDLLFMSPDLTESIQQGRMVRTVFITAGDAGKDAAYWTDREAGILEAYASMAALPNSWEASTLTIAGKRLQLRSLAGSSRVSVVLLHLPDGSPAGSGFRSTHGESLAKLWNDKIPSLHAVDGSASYSKSELVAVLVGLMEQFHAQTVDVQDWTGQFKRDHSDHLHAGRFAHAAAERYSKPHTARAYRGYSLVEDPVNLTAHQQLDKERIVMGYAQHDSQICHRGVPCRPYSIYMGKQYPFIPATLVGPSGKCLQASPVVDDLHGRVELRPCRDLRNQKWSRVGKTLRSDLGGCLSQLRTDPANPVMLVVRVCSDGPEQNWSLARDGALKAGDGSCAMLAPIGAKRGTEILAGDCGDVPEQHWRLYKR
jgi:LmbE family N-acetylglucosaminyl deacetylase